MGEFRIWVAGEVYVVEWLRCGLIFAWSEEFFGVVDASLGYFSWSDSLAE